MNGIFDLKPLIETWPMASSVLVVTTASASLDQWAAALGLWVAIKEAGKVVIMASTGKPTVADANLVGVDQVTQKLGSRNLVISFEYVQDAIEKVSYNVEGKKFNLVIQPKEGSKPLDPASVNYAYEGSDAQVVFVMGAKTLAELGDIYLTEKKVFDQAMVINIDNQMGNAKYGQVNVVDPQTVALSQLTLKVMESLGLPLSADSAGNLLQGLEAATQQWQHPNLTAETFETAAALMRAGAQRMVAPTAQQAASAQQFSQVLKQLAPRPVADKLAVEEPVLEQAVEEPLANPIPDWLKPPKIYRGSDEV